MPPARSHGCVPAPPDPPLHTPASPAALRGSQPGPGSAGLNISVTVRRDEEDGHSQYLQGCNSDVT